MKVIAINGSPHPNGNTAAVLKHMQKEFEAANVEFEVIQVGNKLIHGCIGCGKCWKDPNHECVFKDDIVNEAAKKLREADGIILGSPVYYSGIAGTMKSFLDRVMYTSHGMMRHKVGAAFAVARRTGGSDTFHQLTNYLIHMGFLMPSMQYWGAAYGRNIGEVEEDKEGVQTMVHAAREMIWLMKVVENGKDIPLPEYDPRVATNFVR